MLGVEERSVGVACVCDNNKKSASLDALTLDEKDALGTSTSS